MSTNTKKLVELIENDFKLRLELQKIIDVDSEDDFEETSTVTQLQIINKILEYHEYEPIFEFIDQPSEKLIYEYLNNYAQEIIDKFDLDNGNSEIEFRTDDHGDQNINELLKHSYNATGMYVILEGPNNSTMMSEIEFDIFDEASDSIADYLQKTSDKLYDMIKASLYDFDADYEFEELWAPNPNISAREMLRYLDEDQEFFREVASKM